MRDDAVDTLKIIQYNVRKSRKKVMIEFMAQEEVRQVDVLALTEPWRNTQTGQGYSVSGGPFRVFDAGTLETRVSLLLSKRFTTERIRVITVKPYLVSIGLKVGIGEREKEVVIHATYNPPPASHTVEEVPEQLAAVKDALQAEQGEQILLGDFNLHHEKWGGRGLRERHKLADLLIDATESRGLDLLLEPGTITRDTIKEGERGLARERTTIDLAFGTDWIKDRLLRCGIRRDLHTGSDHLPVEATFALDTRQQGNAKPSRAWKKMDEKKFEKSLSEALGDLTNLGIGLTTSRRIDSFVGRLIESIQHDQGVHAGGKTQPPRQELLDTCLYRGGGKG
jgi:hypothetical protein